MKQYLRIFTKNNKMTSEYLIRKVMDGSGRVMFTVTVQAFAYHNVNARSNARTVFARSIGNQVSLPSPQESATGNYVIQLNSIHTFPLYFIKIHLNTNLTSTSRCVE
jgi:hypothetical protein